MRSMLIFMLPFSAALALREGWSAWQLERALRGHEGYVYLPAFSPDGNRIVTASKDQSARV